MDQWTDGRTSEVPPGAFVADIHIIHTPEKLAAVGRQVASASFTTSDGAGMGGDGASSSISNSSTIGSSSNSSAAAAARKKALQKVKERCVTAGRMRPVR